METDLDKIDSGDENYIDMIRLYYDDFEAPLEQAKKDMGRMLDYIDKLNELDTSDVEPMSHVFPVNNVFREDIVTNRDEREKTLKNAPAQKDGAFKVPRTVE